MKKELRRLLENLKTTKTTALEAAFWQATLDQYVRYTPDDATYDELQTAQLLLAKEIDEREVVAHPGSVLLKGADL